MKKVAIVLFSVLCISFLYVHLASADSVERLYRHIRDIHQHIDEGVQVRELSPREAKNFNARAYAIRNDLQRADRRGITRHESESIHDRIEHLEKDIRRTRRANERVR